MQAKLQILPACNDNVDSIVDFLMLKDSACSVWMHVFNIADFLN